MGMTLFLPIALFAQYSVNDFESELQKIEKNEQFQDEQFDKNVEAVSNSDTESDVVSLESAAILKKDELDLEALKKPKQNNVIKERRIRSR